MENDFAVIVGLQHYPAIDDPANGKPPLSGPENDANDFNRWILCPNGGNVPKQNVKLILSSDYLPVLAPDFSNAKPAELDIVAAFEKLRKISITNIDRGLGSRIGRRLYIFMSGHGISPTPFGTKIGKETGLLMSNVDPTNIGAPRYHIPGTYTATWFCENDCFEEVFLFMDCCRDIAIVSSSNTYLPPKGNSETSKKFFAFATRWSRRSREKLFDGRMQGIFTKTLIMALEGACAEPDPNDPTNGVITGASLKSFLYRNMKKFIDPDFINDLQGQEPDIDYFPKADEGRDIVIRTGVPLAQFPLLINIPTSVTGVIEMVDGRFSSVINNPVKIDQQQMQLALPVGVYLLLYTSNGIPNKIRVEINGMETAGNETIVNLN